MTLGARRGLRAALGLVVRSMMEDAPEQQQLEQQQLRQTALEVIFFEAEGISTNNIKN